MTWEDLCGAESEEGWSCTLSGPHNIHEAHGTRGNLLYSWAARQTSDRSTQIEINKNRDHARVMRHVADVLDQEFPAHPLGGTVLKLLDDRTQTLIQRVRDMADLAEHRNG